jgi:hypothetical protein
MGNIILDSNTTVHQRYQVETTAIYITRPHNYSPYCSEEVEPIDVEQFLGRYLK